MIEFNFSIEKNSQHTDILIKGSSIMKLGYFCEALKTHQSTEISDQDSKVILIGIYVGLDLNEEILEIRICAIKTFQHSSQFMSKLFKYQELEKSDIVQCNGSYSKDQTQIIHMFD